MKFTEAKLEQAIIDLLKEEGYPHVLGEELGLASGEVLIKNDLREYLKAKYKAEKITESEIDAVIRELESYSSSDLYESNKAIMKMVSDGFLLKREDRSQKDFHVNLIDYDDLPKLRAPQEGEVPTIDATIAAEKKGTYNATKNIYKVVNQLEIIGYEKRIPDAILYINGLPLVVFEFKSAIREEATIHNAFIQLTERYKRDIPELFKYNAFCVISDGANNKAGSFFAPYEFFYSWRMAQNATLTPSPSPRGRGEKGVGEKISSSPAGRSGDEGSSSNYRGNYNFAGLVDKARELREKETPAESVMWEILRNRQLMDLKFRRQHQIGDYIVDFFCNEQKLVIELDGTVHDEAKQAKKDKMREAYLKSLGNTVIRFKNEEFLNNPEKTLNKISNYSNKNIKYSLPSTYGRGAGGEGRVRPAEGINSLYTMIGGLFNQHTLRDVIRNFIFIPDTSKQDEKIFCRYPQYYATTKLYTNIKKHLRPEGDGKGGTYFGATGCGKSFTMLFLTRMLMKCVDFASPTIVLITDRTDLDDQLSAQITNAKGYIGDDVVVSVESREQLRTLLKGRESGGVFLTTIHKFTEDTELLTERTNVICISDEAHRSQVNLDQKLKVTDEGVKRTYGFAKYLHDSLPNATYVGFTGTPIDATLDVFGEVVDAYTMTESVQDEITVHIVYEGRAAKVLLDNSKLRDIEKYYAECAEDGATKYQIEESKKATASMNSILGDPDRIKALAADFVQHYETRVNEGATVKGKAMFVCSNRQTAYDFYKEVIRLLGERSSSCVALTNENLKASARKYSKNFTEEYGSPEQWYRKNLPHRDHKGLLQSITFRLADSLPQSKLEQIEHELRNFSKEEIPIQKAKRMQKYLDDGYGCCALKNMQMAEVMQDALKYHDGDKYELVAWCIMPNHVHVLIRTKEDLSKIVQSWKSYTGKWAKAKNNKYNLGIPNDEKHFWQPEFWDRFIRNEEHFINTVKYILNNPEKATQQELRSPSSFIFRGASISERTKQELHPSQIKMVMTRNQDDPKELYDMLGTKDDRKELDRQFKNEKSNFKIAIVVDMWLTGFDVPFLDTIYIDKPVQRHSLIQTISRVNRKFRQKEKGLVVDYIGIKKQMNLALAHYSKADQTNFEDIQAAVIVVKDHLDLIGKIFHIFDSKPYFTGSPKEQLECLNLAVEFVQLTEKMEKRFMGLVKRLKSAYDICCGSEDLNQDERDHIHFYLAVRSIVFKLTKGDAPDTAQMNARVKEMIKEAIQSDGVEEIYKIGDDDISGIDIFDEDYLAKIAKIKLPNTKIKLLQQLLARAIEEFKKVNKIKGIDFSKKLQSLVDKYNERDEKDTLRSEVLEDFTDEIIELFNALKKEKESFGELGINFEEKAFYDILKALAVKYDFEYPEEKLLLLSKEVKKVVDDKAKYTDWSQRDDIKAELKVDLIMLLAKHNYPPVDRDEVYKEIFEQAENFKKYQMT